MVDFTIGADPEIFLRNKNGEAVSAHGVISGTKESPFPVTDGAYQVDGMAVEFNVEPTPLQSDNRFDQPTKEMKLFNQRIVSVMKQMETAVRSYDPHLRFELSPVQEFDAEYMDKQPNEAKELGCNPDMNAYTKEQNPPPEGDSVNYRTASGHVHIGWGADIPVDHPDHIDICCDFIKMMDAGLGMFMTIIDSDPRRRELYGKAGAFRPKPYGVEYRTPSNVWLTHVDRRTMVYRLSKMVVDAHSSGYGIDRLKSTPEGIQEIINTGNFEKAFSILHMWRRSSRMTDQMWKIIKKEFKQRCTDEGKLDVYNTWFPPQTLKESAKELLVEKTSTQGFQAWVQAANAIPRVRILNV